MINVIMANYQKDPKFQHLVLVAITSYDTLRFKSARRDNYQVPFDGTIEFSRIRPGDSVHDMYQTTKVYGYAEPMTVTMNIEVMNMGEFYIYRVHHEEYGNGVVVQYGWFTICVASPNISEMYDEARRFGEADPATWIKSTKGQSQ